MRRVEFASVMVAVLVGPLISAVGIWYSNNQVRDQLKISSQELNLAQEGQVTDRYIKAVENLGDESLDVRLGAIYAMQRIMETAPQEQPTIANVLNAYVRTHAGKPRDRGKEPPADVRAALTLLAFRDTSYDGPFRLDLRQVDLSGIDLRSFSGKRRADLSDAWLQGADFSGAYLDKIDLSDSYLSNADLSRAYLNDADLSGANFSDADLSGTHLGGADLSGTGFWGTDLSGARGNFCASEFLREHPAGTPCQDENAARPQPSP